MSQAALARWVVEIDASQVSILDKAIANVRAQMTGMENAAKQSAANMTAGFQVVQNAVTRQSELIRSLGGAYDYLKAQILYGFVRAGMAATAEGERLAFMTGFLAREIASVFTPAIHATIAGIERMVSWFRNLGGEHQQAIRNATAAALGFLGVSKAVEFLTARAVGLGSALRALFVGNPILLVASALVGLLAMSEQGRQTLGNLFAAALPLANALARVIEAMQPMAELVAAVLTPVLTILSAIVEKLSPLIGIIGPMVILTYLFTTLGNLLVTTWTKGTAALAAYTAATTAQSAAEMNLMGAFGMSTAAAWNAARAKSMAAAPGVLGSITGALGPVGIIGAIAGLGLGLVGLLSARSAKPREELLQGGGAFESVESSFNRVQAAVNRADVAQRTRERQVAILDQIAENTGRGAPAAAAAVGP